MSNMPIKMVSDNTQNTQMLVEDNDYDFSKTT